ncbi:hypothetical protein SY27_07750 [Flavobacterium sp. 316]|uniref:hypothetical protein n=1 Tax=Flavobacterium sp. 316 TaxID=1603293 RepID=UPI0005DB4B9E|nr:hypothetical protein [Flavobacterium sp. 316]KIX21583.1 hypothetical protein SY27_07750 [Flavobacterium sp. 316]
MDTILKSFEKDFGVLRGLIKSSGYETDPYRIIILVERYILEYGTTITRKTVDFLLSKEVSVEERQNILLDVLQTIKTPEQLFLTIHSKKGSN